MPFKTSFDERRQLMRVSFNGVVECDDFLAAFKALKRDPRNDVAVPELIDFEQVADITASVDTIRALARDGSPNKTAPMAINAPRDFAYGVARMFVAMREPGDREVSIFRSRPEAESWIEIGPGSKDE